MSVKTMGVLGGMGPASTVYFLDRVIQLTPADNDQDHIPMVISNNPQIPDRTAAILRGGTSPVPQLVNSLTILGEAGCDFICIPCNTVHYFLDEIQRGFEIAILSLIDAVAQFTMKRLPGLNKVGLLATRGTIETRLYHTAFEKFDTAVITLDNSSQKRAQHAIQAIKRGSKDPREIQAQASQLVGRGCEAVVLGCTELSLICDDLNIDVPVLDSTEIYAKTAVEHALRHK